MESVREILEARAAATRREFLTTTASGLGMMALGAMLTESGVLTPARAEAAGELNAAGLLRLQAPHFRPRAKSCIFIFMEGAPSQIDLFDPKPKLQELHGEQLPPSMTEKVRFAFIQKETAVLMASRRKFARHGQCGMELSELIPNLSRHADDLCLIRSLHTDQFNHHPGQLLMQCGAPRFGLPSMGSWITYGLGSESRDLPGYVVLASGRGGSGGTTLWSSGFIPSSHAGVLFLPKGDPVLDLAAPPGLPRELERRGLDVLRSLNESRYRELRDPEISSRIASYELAYRMQASAPELIDVKGESARTLERYGLGREDIDPKDQRGSGGPGTFSSFAANCLLARRLVERGVRFINIIYASWDHHNDIDRQLQFNCRCVDQPIAALIGDLKERGLLDETLVVWGSEFGRTPLAENRRGDREPNTGRDHHPFAFSMFLAGGGTRGGTVYGATDEIGWSVIEKPMHINDLHATLLHLFGLDHLRLTYRFQGRDFRLTDVGGKVVEELIA
jgi:hypothetical protein